MKATIGWYHTASLPSATAASMLVLSFHAILLTIPPVLCRCMTVNTDKGHSRCTVSCVYTYSQVKYTELVTMYIHEVLHRGSKEEPRDILYRLTKTDSGSDAAGGGTISSWGEEEVVVVVDES